MAAAKTKSLWDRWEHVSGRTKLIWTTGSGFIAFVLAVMNGYAFLSPHLEIVPGIIASETDASAVEFTIKNTGHFAISNALLECIIFAGGRKYDSKGNIVIDETRSPMVQFIASLEPQKLASRNCGAGLLGAPFPATYDVTVKFEWPWHLGELTRTEHFISIKGGDGRMHVQQDAN